MNEDAVMQSLVQDLEQRQAAAEASGDVEEAQKLAAQLSTLNAKMGKGNGQGEMPKSKIFKPGDWSCPSCGNINWHWRTACNKCQTPVPSAVPQQHFAAPPSAPVPQYSQAGRPPAPPPQHRPGDWQCENCMNVNFAYREACNKCGIPKPPVAYRSTAPPMAPAPVTYAPVQSQFSGPLPPQARPGDWLCNNCGNVNFARRTECNKCQTPREDTRPPPASFDQNVAPGVKMPKEVRKGDWQCTSCGNVNFAHRVACNQCKLPKPTSDQGYQPYQALGEQQ